MENQLKELQAIYLKIAIAFQNKDLDGIAKYIAPDFTGSHGAHKVTRETLLANVRSQFKDFDEISWPRTLSEAKMDGDKLTVKAEGTYRAVKSESREPFQMELANYDTWRNGPDGWQNVYSIGLDT